ncbi:ArsC/Spx/MgsR family protein [Sulfitobacter geojensis]|uniref:Arsenate reductase n=1 Tax=Sulfitobacter geojensis TaxID=1342299 RepID=A0AAE3B505_9RHOB|nr:ArsC/Spx/MgsR family protein [Sulfitobacter geojensis]MBM1687694.1 arsenate reductase [Sulfitobacter geojensis]MBM1691761.1 arsenate reductase [Sulfitobacter geojensis]MBM1703927.1 arsenate reductase [Sulfitobacter geojensis]MBM1707985.1 arsenate reductase [Sulfitobacter geojensis]MBM1712050.1 arsenate reductase [Sulfitobacter geojensis]
MILYGLKNCDTCRKALKSLPHAELRDVRKDGVPEAVLAAALEKFGDALLNTRSTTWRGLSEAQRQAAPMDLLKAHPALMKRPLIDVNNTLFLGWNNAVEADIKASL